MKRELLKLLAALGGATFSYFPTVGPEANATAEWLVKLFHGGWMLPFMLVLVNSAWAVPVAVSAWALRKLKRPAAGK